MDSEQSQNDRYVEENEDQVTIHQYSRNFGSLNSNDNQETELELKMMLLKMREDRKHPSNQKVNLWEWIHCNFSPTFPWHQLKSKILPAAKDKILRLLQIYMK